MAEMIYCECCKKSYKLNYYNYTHQKSNIHKRNMAKCEDVKAVKVIKKVIKKVIIKKVKVIKKVKKESKFEKKLNMLNDINELFIKYGEAVIMKELSIQKANVIIELTIEDDINNNEYIIDNNKKVCNKCNIEYDIEKFSKEGRNRDGRKGACNKCRYKQRKERESKIAIINEVIEEVIEEEVIEEEVIEEVNSIDELINKRKCLLIKRTNAFYKCVRNDEKTKCIKSFEDELNKMDIEINELIRINKGVYIKLNEAESEKERVLRVIEYVKMERDIFLSGGKISWDRIRVSERYDDELELLNNYINSVYKIL